MINVLTRVFCTRMIITSKYFSTNGCLVSSHWSAALEKISKKQAAHLLIEAVFSYWYGQKVKQNIKNREAARKLSQKLKITRFMRELKKYCKEQGINLQSDWTIKDEK